MAFNERVSIRQTAAKAAADITAACVQAGFLDSLDAVRQFMSAEAQRIHGELEADLPEDSGDSGGGENLTVEEAKSGVLNFGKFKGKTLGQVLDMPASETEEYGYKTGPGKQYIQWLTTHDRNRWAQRRAEMIMESLQAESE